MEKSPFLAQWITPDDMVNIVAWTESFTKLLLNMQLYYRASRALSEDEGDKLLHGSRMIDEIVISLSTLEPALKEYTDKKREEELKKVKNDID